MERFSAQHLEELFGWMCPHGPLALAVSGGGDSTALMHLCARWRETSGKPVPALHVLSVDHGLHAESAAVARRVCAQARELGLPCAVLRWEGEKPHTGIEEAARAARHALLAEWCAAHDAALVMAHTLDDQAETLLMRLARGAGLDGLTAMAREAMVPGFAPPVALLRPLLGVSRQTLRTWLQEQNIDWHEDPANADKRFERVRLRNAWPQLAALGLTPEKLALSARRLQRAKAACAHYTGEAWGRHARWHDLGWLELPIEALRTPPEEIALRLLARAAAKARGLAQAGRDMAGLERLLRWLRETDTPRARSLAGVHFERHGETLLVGREPGRIGPPLELSPPAMEIIWDDRLRLRFSNLRTPLRVMALAQVLKTTVPPKDAPSRPPRAPAFAWRAQPAVLADDALIALPLTGWQAADAPFAAVRATWATPDAHHPADNTSPMKGSSR